MAALVLSFRQFHELAQELSDLSAFVSCLESVHARAIEPSEQIDEFCGANLGRYKGVSVLEHGDLLPGHSRLIMRSMMLLSTSQVIGLTKPSSGGGVNDELIFSSCETKDVDSFG